VTRGAFIVGDVELGPHASVWYGAVLRGDYSYIKIGENTNVQDNVTIHCDEGFPALIGKNVSIGHGAVVHGALVEDHVIIGINSVILNGAKIGSGSVIGAGSVVPEKMDIPPNSLVVGVPAKVKKTDEKFLQMCKLNAELYLSKSKEHKEGKYDLYSPDNE